MGAIRAAKNHYDQTKRNKIVEFVNLTNFVVHTFLLSVETVRCAIVTIFRSVYCKATITFPIDR